MLTGGLQNSSAENIYYPVGGKICSLLFFNIIIAKCLWELSYLRIIKFCICMGILAHCTSRFSSSKYKDIFNSGKQAVPFLPLFLSLHLQCQGLKQGPHCSSTAELHPQPFSLSLHVSVQCFPYHVFMSVLYREGSRHYPKSLRGCTAPFPTLLTTN